MDDFLIWLDKYELLIELVITVLTIILSLVALFQTKSIAKRQLRQEENIAKQQAYLQEKQIKISVHEQKTAINKALDKVFNVAGTINLILQKIDLHSLSKEKVYCLINCVVEDVNTNDIIYVLGLSRFFLNPDLSVKIRFVKTCFNTITMYTGLLNILANDDEKEKTELIDEIIKACADIEKMQPEITSDMIKELKIVD